MKAGTLAGRAARSGAYADGGSNVAKRFATRLNVSQAKDGLARRPDRPSLTSGLRLTAYIFTPIRA